MSSGGATVTREAAAPQRASLGGATPRATTSVSGSQASSRQQLADLRKASRQIGRLFGVGGRRSNRSPLREQRVDRCGVHERAFQGKFQRSLAIQRSYSTLLSSAAERASVQVLGSKSCPRASGRFGIIPLAGAPTSLCLLPRPFFFAPAIEIDTSAVPLTPLLQVPA